MIYRFKEAELEKIKNDIHHYYLFKNESGLPDGIKEELNKCWWFDLQHATVKDTGNKLLVCCPTPFDPSGYRTMFEVEYVIA